MGPRLEFAAPLGQHRQLLLLAAGPLLLQKETGRRPVQGGAAVQELVVLHFLGRPGQRAEPLQLLRVHESLVPQRCELLRRPTLRPRESLLHRSDFTFEGRQLLWPRRGGVRGGARRHGWAAPPAWRGRHPPEAIAGRGGGASLPRATTDASLPGPGLLLRRRLDRRRWRRGLQLLQPGDLGLELPHLEGPSRSGTPQLPRPFVGPLHGALQADLHLTVILAAD